VTLYYVHNDLLHQVKVFYSLEEAQNNSNEYCHITCVEFKHDVLIAYQASLEKFAPLFKKLAE